MQASSLPDIAKQAEEDYFMEIVQIINTGFFAPSEFFKHQSTSLS